MALLQHFGILLLLLSPPVTEHRFWTISKLRNITSALHKHRRRLPPHCQLTALPLTTRAKNLRLIRFQSIYPDGRVLILQGSEQTPDKEHWTFSFSLIPGMGGLIPSRTAMSKGAMRKWLRQRASWKGDQLLANDLWEELRIIRKETAMERALYMQFPHR